MTKFKKCMLALVMGAGFGISLNAWALPGCDTCNDMYTSCQAGNTTACGQFSNLRCQYYSGQECAIF